MGTDYCNFLAEAKRVLKCGGYLWIAEVRSRFVPKGGSNEDYDAFTKAVTMLGFKLVEQDISNRMFVVWLFRKKAVVHDANEISWPVLKACIYKRR
jgi:ribosomal RNA-processing protein 8